MLLLRRGFALSRSFIASKQELASVLTTSAFSRLPLSQCSGNVRREFACKSHSASFFASHLHRCFSPCLASLVDLSDYLKNGCDWQKAPSCPDYVGPISIARTPDGRGRGLYASGDVEAGDILMISNAFAASYNDNDCSELFTKIVEIVQRSPKALRQFYSLAGYDFHDDMEVPDIKLFDSHCSCTDEDPQVNLDFDEKRIMHIMNVNSFEGELPSASSVPDTRLTGLWLLPSFINHSCSPNCSRLVVGEAMFIIASCNIHWNEEITISYTDSMSPLKKREDNLAAMGYGFHCQCKRCTTERSVQQELREFSERYIELYEKASDEVEAAATSFVDPCIENFVACKELSDVYSKLLEQVHSLSNLTKIEKQWILGGYSSAFLGKWLVRGYTSEFSPPPEFVTPSALELVTAMKVTVPGMLRTLSFITMLANVAGKDNKQQFSVIDTLMPLALDECIRVYGKQKLDVVIKLMEQSSGIVPFF